MMKCHVFKMTPHAICKAVLTWAHYDGFSGKACGKCNITINILRGGAGWFCPQCEGFNVQCFSGGPMPWDYPDFGPTRRTIYAGHELATLATRLRRKYMDEQEVLANMKAYPFRLSEADWRPGRIVKMRDDCHHDMRWYTVRLQDGRETMVYEEDIRHN